MEFLLQAGWLRGFGMSGLVILVALAMWYCMPCRLLPDWMLLHRSLQCSADMQTVDCCCISLKPFFIVLPGVFMVAFLQNILGAWLTPFAKKLLATRRKTVRIARGTRHCILSFHAFPTFYILLLLFDCTFFIIFLQAGLKQEGYRAKLGVAPWISLASAVCFNDVV